MPALNEEKYIAKTIVGCKKYVDKVIVVDDGSTDATAEIAEALGAIVIKHPMNRGYGATLQSIFAAAREMDVDAMVIIDSDGQHDPGEISKLLAPLNHGMDLVIGSRFIDGNGANVPVYRKVGMKVLDTATNFAGEIHVSDSQSGFRAYGKKAIEKIRINDCDMSAGSEILMQIKDHGLKFEEVEIHCRYDIEDTSSQSAVSHGVKVLLKLLKDIELRRPLFYFTVPGIFILVVGLSMGVSFLQSVRVGIALPFGPTLFMLMLTLTGMFMAFTGIILHSMSRLINESKI